MLRGKFDQWLSEQAEEAGAMLVYGVRVDSLIVRDGAVCGVIAGDEEMKADVVVLADGANSLLAQQLGARGELTPQNTALGVKEVIGLSADVINERFGLAGDEGLAWMFLGAGAPDGCCDAFLYTNKESVSLGITMQVAGVDATTISTPQLLEDFKCSPLIAPLVAGGKLLEYAAHLIPEHPRVEAAALVGDGVLLTGDAAALCANLGFTLRGMDLAIESGCLAGEAVLAAKEAGDFSAAGLASYATALTASFVMPCLHGAEHCQEAARTLTTVEELNQTLQKAIK